MTKYNSPIVMSHTVYILKLINNKTYVGISKNFINRLHMHMSGSGAKWTQKYPVIGVEYVTNVENIQKAKLLEKKFTLEFMELRGINNVRGAGYSRCKDYNEYGATKMNMNIFLNKDLCIKNRMALFNNQEYY